MRNGDPFDAKKLRIDPNDPNLKPKKAGRSKPGKKWQRKFVQVPWEWADRLKAARHCTTYRLALLLLYEDWRTGGRAIRLSNAGLAEEGMTRKSKSLALGELRGLGLIQVEGGPRKSPKVTLLLRPKKRW